MFKNNLMWVWNLFTHLMIESNVSRTCFKLAFDLYIVCFYIPPTSSTSLTRTVQKRQITEREVAYFSTKSNIMLLWDFNARTGDDKDLELSQNQNFLS